MKKTVSNEIKKLALQILFAIRENNMVISAIGLFRLIIATSKLQTPQIVVLHNYVSDKSDKTIACDYTILVGTKYDKAKESSIKKIGDLDQNDVNAIAENCTPDKIKGFRFINRNGLSATEYCNEVIKSLPDAINEMKNVGTTTTNFLHINSVLKYSPIETKLLFDANGNPDLYVKGEKKGQQKTKQIGTGNLLISGELIGNKRKQTEICPNCNNELVNGASIFMDLYTVCPICNYKIKDLPKTGTKATAKMMIGKYLNTRTSKIETFNVSNLHYISIGKEKIELCPAED